MCLQRLSLEWSCLYALCRCVFLKPRFPDWYGSGIREDTDIIVSFCLLVMSVLLNANTTPDQRWPSLTDVSPLGRHWGDAAEGAEATADQTARSHPSASPLKFRRFRLPAHLGSRVKNHPDVGQVGAILERASLSNDAGVRHRLGVRQ